MNNQFFVTIHQGSNAKKGNCSCVFSAYILKPVFLKILIIHMIVSYDQNNNSKIFYVKDGSHVRLWHPSCLHYRPETVHCSTEDAYTSEITFLALLPWLKQCKSLLYIKIWYGVYCLSCCLKAGSTVRCVLPLVPWYI